LPRGEAAAVAMSLVELAPKMIEDRTFVSRERPENLLRWDVTVAPGRSGEKACPSLISRPENSRGERVAVATIRTEG
jgi:hypothetical protein